jgi:hypothetical protein
MLARVETINWDALNEPNIPEWLNNLVSEDAQTRKEAFESLAQDLAPWAVLEGCYPDRLLDLVNREVVIRFYSTPDRSASG